MIHGSCVVTLAALTWAAAPLQAQQDGREPAPVLSLEDAINIAKRQNHLLASTAQVVDEADERASALRTRRLPGLHLDAYGARLLNKIDVKIPSIAGLGPFPGVVNTVSIPESWGVIATASASQPLTQQYRIGLGIEIANLDRQVAEEDLRRERQRLAAQVRTSYYQISAREAGVVALRDIVRSVEELDSVTTRYLAEELVLKSDALEVKARLTRERQRLAQAENVLASQREQLNQLLGRDVRVPVRVATPSELTRPDAGLTLETARERARASRAEIRTASLRTSQADTSRRLAIAGWIPDVSLTASYTRLVNFKSSPQEAGIVGALFSWEPFDWGRKAHEAAERAHSTERARQGREETEQEILVEVGTRWRALEDAAALLEATRLETEASAASLETDRNRYRADAAILRDLLRTEARLSTARRDFTDALADYWSAAAELKRVIGNEND